MNIKNLFNKITKNPSLVVRIVLFLTFFGHGLVSLKLSPSYGLHYNIVSSIDFIKPFVSPETLLTYQGVFDIILALFFLFGIQPITTSVVAMLYLIVVGVAAWIFYYSQTASLFGLAEVLRRTPWLMFALFLFLSSWKDKKIFTLIRVGVSFAFLAHGVASLGFMGLKGGHIELATNILAEETAMKFVVYAGISDVIIGISLLTGLFSKFFIYIGIVWIILIVILSAMTAFPDAIFRSGFLLSAIYVALDQRCHKRTLVNLNLSDN